MPAPAVPVGCVRGKGGQLLQCVFHGFGDQGWRSEVLTAMNHPMGDQFKTIPEWLEGWCQPALEHLLQVVAGVEVAVLLPGAGPGVVHQGRFETGTAEVDDEAELAHLRTSQVISTLSGSTDQMFRQYSVMDRSEEKKPVRAVFSSDIRFQCIRSLQARLTASWART